MRVHETIIKEIWQRRSQESWPPFPLHMDDGDFTAIDLYGGIGGYMLRSDGAIVEWDMKWDKNLEIEYRVETDPDQCIGALVMALERIPELQKAIPARPEKAQDCVDCNGQGLTDLPNAPRFLLCKTCWGLGWRA